MPWNNADDARQLRHRTDADRFDLDRLNPSRVDPGLALVVEIVPAGYGYSEPGTSPGVFAAWPCAVDAVQKLGGTVTITPDTSTILLVVNLGSANPTGGEHMLAEAIDGYLIVVFE